MNVLAKSLIAMLVTMLWSASAWAGNAVAIESVKLSNEGFLQSSGPKNMLNVKAIGLGSTAAASGVRTEQLNNKYPENTGGTSNPPTQNDCMSCD